MSNLLAVQDPDEGTTEVATETRRLLQVWADQYLPDSPKEALVALTDTQVKALRADGAAALATVLEGLKGIPNHNPASEFGGMLLGFAGAVKVVNSATSAMHKARELSYALEGVCKDFTRRFFEAGMQWNLHAEWLALNIWNYPNRTNGYQDKALETQLGSAHRSMHTYFIQGDLTSHLDWGDYLPYEKVVKETGARFKEIGDWLVMQAGREVNNNREYWAGRMTESNYAGVQLHYMDEDGPWVAGFLSVQDAARMRFRRVRLGAFLTELGFSDGVVRTKVERAKQQVAGAQFEVFPNDCLWEEVYTTGPNSCMSDSSDDYDTWDGIHPVCVYSSSYYGAGDNSLALLISRDDDGEITGRGILNLQRNSIVRWYGDAVAERVLLRNGVKVDDRSAMKGSWLALITNSRGTKFIRPYVDGDHGQGEVQGNRVVIGRGGLDLQCTSGAEYLGETQYCIDTEEREDEDCCEYQPIQGNYISNSCDDWRCPVIGEYSSGSDRSWMHIHGELVEVSDYVRYGHSAFLTEYNRINGQINFTIDDPEVRQRFIAEYGAEDYAEQDEDEEAA